MDSIKIHVDWFDELLPDGLPLKTSTVITGPGGSGKPLIGEYMMSSWLKNGGSVILISLQYPNTEFVTESAKNLTGINLKDYEKNIVFVQLKTEIEGVEQISPQLIHANLVKPKVWGQIIDLASNQLPKQNPGILLFVSALNILLFSPTYGDQVFDTIKQTISQNKELSYLFAVSTTAKKEKIAELELLADNLIRSYSEKNPFKLFMAIERIKKGDFLSKTIQIPVSADTLNYIKKLAEHSRKRVIPIISKI